MRTRVERAADFAALTEVLNEGKAAAIAALNAAQELERLSKPIRRKKKAKQ